MNMAMNNQLKWPLKAIATLLHYPDEMVQQHVDQVLEVLLIRPEFSTEERSMLERFGESLRHDDLFETQAAYVELFDRSKKVSLYLFEHVHGESRDRGTAMVELANAYREQGLEMNCSEFPDYLPLFLEFCAGLPEADARGWLDDIGHIVQLIHIRLDDRRSPYALPFRLLLRLTALELRPDDLVEETRDEERDDTPAALDRSWMESPVTFGPEQQAGGCGSSQQSSVRPVQWYSSKDMNSQSGHL